MALFSFGKEGRLKMRLEELRDLIKWGYGSAGLVVRVVGEDGVKCYELTGARVGKSDHLSVTIKEMLVVEED